MRPARLLTRAANVKIVGLAGIDQFLTCVTASTKCTFSNIQNFMKNTGDARSASRSSSASERASASGRVGPRATSRERLRAVREQASVDVTPVVLGHGRYFSIVFKQSKDRGTSIKFYGTRAGVLALSNQYEITFCHGGMEQYLMG